MSIVKWTEIFILGFSMAIGLTWFNFTGLSSNLPQDRSVGQNH